MSRGCWSAGFPHYKLDATIVFHLLFRVFGFNYFFQNVCFSFQRPVSVMKFPEAAVALLKGSCFKPV